MKDIEKAAAYLLGTTGDGFDPIAAFKELNDKEKLRLMDVVKKMGLDNQHTDD